MPCVSIVAICMTNKSQWGKIFSADSWNLILHFPSANRWFKLWDMLCLSKSLEWFFNNIGLNDTLFVSYVSIIQSMKWKKSEMCFGSSILRLNKTTNTDFFGNSVPRAYFI